MGQSVILTGAQVKIYVGGKLYPEVQSIQYSIDYGETPIYGIDSYLPQEIVPGQVSVQGSVNGLLIKGLGGLQAYELRPKINEILSSSYISLRINDRHTNEEIFWLPQMRVTSEQISIQAKGVVRVSFQFKGIVPYNPADLSG